MPPNVQQKAIIHNLTKLVKNVPSYFTTNFYCVIIIGQGAYFVTVLKYKVKKKKKKCMYKIGTKIDLFYFIF